MRKKEHSNTMLTQCSSVAFLYNVARQRCIWRLYRIKPAFTFNSNEYAIIHLMKRKNIRIK